MLHRQETPNLTRNRKAAPNRGMWGAYRAAGLIALNLFALNLVALNRRAELLKRADFENKTGRLQGQSFPQTPALAFRPS
jgi:hypothetical protein